MAIAVHLLNISPTKAVCDVTPYEAWWKQNPNVSNLRIFGCIVYSLIDSIDRSKLDKKSEKCIFVGYSDKTKGYRLYNPLTKSLIIRRDIVFDENSSWDWNKIETQHIPFLEECSQTHSNTSQAPNFFESQ